jgi:hypothetical protein
MGRAMDDAQKKPQQDDPFAQSDVPVIDGEVVEEPTSGDASSSTGSDPFKVGSEFNYLQNLQTQINLNITKIENLKEEMQPVKEMIEAHLENDPEYIELTKKAKEASTEKGRRKKELMQAPNAKSLEEKMQKLKEDQKEANDMISQLLDEYRKETGANEFEGSDGELRTIVMIAKLVRKTNLNRD